MYASVPTADFKVENAEPEHAELQENWYDFYLNPCNDWMDRTVMFKALSYFAKRTTSFTSYWVYETIENDEGSFDNVLKNKWVEFKELKLFTGSINRYAIEEGHDRHDEGPKDNYNRPRTTLSEARMFLAQKLLKPWLIKKPEIFKLAEGEARAKYLSNEFLYQ